MKPDLESVGGSDDLRDLTLPTVIHFSLTHQRLHFEESCRASDTV